MSHEVLHIYQICQLISAIPIYVVYKYIPTILHLIGTFSLVAGTLWSTYQSPPSRVENSIPGPDTKEEIGPSFPGSPPQGGREIHVIQS